MIAPKSSITQSVEDRRDFCERAQEALRSGDLVAITDAELTEIMTLATRVYAAKSEAQGLTFEPVDATHVTATEIVVTVSGMLHAANLNLFDVAMWYRRPGYGELPAGGLRP
jgi:hypothetical protein